MNKAETIIVSLLILLLFVWLYSQQHTAVPERPHASPTNVVSAVAEREAVSAGGEAGPSEHAVIAAPAAAAFSPGTSAASVPIVPATTVLLTNRQLAVSMSSAGATITSVELKEYWRTVERKERLRLDFSPWPALALHGWPQFGTNASFEVVAQENSSLVTWACEVDSQRFERTVELTDGYQLKITETFANRSSQVVEVPEHSLACGPMVLTEAHRTSGDFAFLGADSLPEQGGEGVRHWMKGGGFFRKSPVLQRFYDKKSVDGMDLPLFVALRDPNPISWMAAKNKFFVQVLAPTEEGSTVGCELYAWRHPGASRLEVAAVGATAIFPRRTLQPGETFTRHVSYYVGPKKYSLLKELGPHQVDIMEFGTWFGWICKLLLPTLNAIYAVVPNYGVAIIVLTVLVRIVFWPITHKSTEDMKRMASLQPLIAELRVKYKDKPQKLNQELMALYREHKVNPMSGCLPLLVQIPVFFALFTVLRSAIELRFASFLWIKDLSEPERLFEGTRFFAMLPLVDSLNILPLLMTATTVWQQKLTPTTGDPQQQKMMMLMPIFMLFLFYNMASALVLYWTTSQLLAIGQLLWQQRRTRAQNKTAA